MINSRDINLLKPYVKYLAEQFIIKCKESGLNVLITSTVRDDEYQSTLYAQGRTKPGSIVTNSSVVGPHGYGLAFDFCQNVKGNEYPASFMKSAGAIGKSLGLEWGGDWKSFPDTPHLQYVQGLTTSQIRAGALPKFPPIPSKPAENVNVKAYKEIIQAKLKFSDPSGVWILMDQHKNAEEMYRKWSASYK